MESLFDKPAQKVVFSVSSWI